MSSTWHSAGHREPQCSVGAPCDLAPLDSTRVLGDEQPQRKRGRPRVTSASLRDDETL